jgi:hypothetical protein
MFHPSAIANRRPFAPSALPEIIALIGAPDFPTPPVPSSLLRLVRDCAPTCTRQCRDLHGYRTFSIQARLGLRSRVGSACSPLTHAALLPAGVLKPSALSNEKHFGTASFTAALGRHSTSLAFLPTHQAPCYQSTSKARYRACG